MDSQPECHLTHPHEHRTVQFGPAAHGGVVCLRTGLL